MMPIGPLMIEHRLIERMVALMNRWAMAAEQTGDCDTDFVEVALDFVTTYADRCHHGKEEDILFAELGRKPLTDEHRVVMNELAADHAWAREHVAGLRNTLDSLTRGDTAKRPALVAGVRELASFYPSHIRKEDKQFFIPVMSYLTRQEQDAMLEAFWEFDRKLIHEKYKAVVRNLEAH